MINDYFSEIGPKLASLIPKSTNGISVLGERNQEVFELRDFEMDEVLKCFKKISIYKSSGMSEMSTRFFKDTLLYMPNIILHLFNRVKNTGTFPDKWKIATVVPLPKCNNPSELRPVSLLPLIGNYWKN